MNMANETISEKCETLYNKLNAFVTSVISRDVTPKISNLNTEVWGSDTQTGNSRIDTLNTNFNNLDSSITTMESDINNVKSNINNVESDVSNLQTSVNSLSDSITNLIQVQEVHKNTPSISAGSTSAQTFTVTACPTGYSWKYFSTSTGWGTVSSVSLSGTTLTVKLLNVSNSSHSINFRGVLVYYPSSWNI